MAKEIINCVAHTMPGFFVLEALVEAGLIEQVADEAAKRAMDVDRDPFALKASDVEVELFVNGHSVSLTSILNGIWARAHANLEKEILDKAVELVGRSGLQDLSNAISDAEWQIRDKLEEAFGK